MTERTPPTRTHAAASPKQIAVMVTIGTVLTVVLGIFVYLVASSAAEGADDPAAVTWATIGGMSAQAGGLALLGMIFYWTGRQGNAKR